MSEWISVKDRLPETDQKVLVIEEIYPDIVFGRYIRFQTSDVGVIGKWDTEIAEDRSNVTHWMKLPAPLEPDFLQDLSEGKLGNT